MAANERLVNIIREAFVDIPNVEEKNLFGGMCFMIDDKMCIGVNKDEIICRLAPDVYEEALELNGVRPMIHMGRPAKNFLYVSGDILKTQKDFDYWINNALAYNKIAEPSKSKAKKK